MNPTVTTAPAIPAASAASVAAASVADNPPGAGPSVVLSGIQPSGHLTLGNYLGALRRFAVHQYDATCLFPIVDLHALTVPQVPARLRALTREVALLYLASGIDPDVSVVFRQSDVPAHTQLSYLLECVATTGELGRMIQFKEKGRNEPTTRASLFTYPVLMAADILVYGTSHVPVGEDQRQHLELARDLAVRFNRTYGDAFVVPELLPATTAARVMDLSDPTRKMSKDAPLDAMGVIRVLDRPDVVARKVRRAVTDADPELVYDPVTRPAVANLLEILGACSGRRDLDVLAGELRGGAALKAAVTDAVLATLAPVQERFAELAGDAQTLDEVLTTGAERASTLAAPRLRVARELMGLT